MYGGKRDVRIEPQVIELPIAEGGVTTREIAISNGGKNSISLIANDNSIVRFLSVRKTNEQVSLANRLNDAKRKSSKNYPFSIVRSDDPALKIEKQLFGESQRSIIIPSGETVILNVEISTAGKVFSSLESAISIQENNEQITELPIIITSLTSVSLPFNDDIEGGINGWTSTGFWHRVQNPQLITVSPLITPRLVSFPDNGALPQPTSGQFSWWYGQDSTGTYIGPNWNPAQGDNSGGDGASPNSGTLVSPIFDLTGQTNVTMKFWSWWEVEGVDVNAYDLMRVEISVDGGNSYLTSILLNPVNDADGESYVPYSSGGLGQIGIWQEQVLDLTPYVGNNQVVIRFNFNSVDNLFNGFRGWFVDDISVTSGAVPAPVITSIEPYTVNNSTNEGIEVMGDNFSISAVIELLNSSFVTVATLTSSTISSELIEAIVPGGTSIGQYHVRVTNNNGLRDTLLNGLTVTNVASPHITTVTPDSGLYDQSVNITITGSSFQSGATVKLGKISLTNVVVVNANTITATVPPLGFTGKLTLRVTNPDGQFDVKVDAYYAYAVEAIISGYKYNDLDADGIKDKTEGGLIGWTIVLSGTESDTTETDEEGFYEFAGLSPGSYTIHEVNQPGWTQTFPTANSGTYVLTLQSRQVIANRNFLNYIPPFISGKKWFDANANGIKDAEERGLPGWRVRLSGTETDSTLTDENGDYIFANLTPGNYVVSEGNILNGLGWSQTSPVSGLFTHNNFLASISTDNFGNSYTPLASTAEYAADGNTAAMLHFNEAGSAYAYDVSEKGNHGTLSQTSVIEAGKYGSAKLFDGIDDGIAIANAVNLNSTMFTAELWFKTNGVQTANAALLNKYSSNAGYVIAFGANGQSLQCVIGTGSASTTISSAINFADNNWHHVALLYDGSTAILHIDGLVRATASVSNYTTSSSSVKIADGSGDWAGAYFNGSIDEVRLSNIARNMDNLQGAGTSSISGVVFNDLNGNAVKDPGDPLATGWIVSLSGNDTKVDTTLANGEYYFGALPAGNYTVTLTVPSGYTQTLPLNLAPYEFALTDGQTAANNHFGTFQYGTISGKKFNDANANGVLDLSESGIQNWKIYIGGSKVDSLLTSVNGNYSFTNLLAGTYSLTEAQVSGWIQRTSNPANVTVTSGTVSSNKNFGNYQPFSISGFVYEDMNGNGTKDIDESGLISWKVKLSNAKTDSVNTGESGEYSFINLGSGTYRVRTETQEGFVQSSSNPADIVAVAGSSVANVNFGIFKTISISGVVYLDHNGNGMKEEGDNGQSNWYVNLSGTATKKDTSDENGFYSFSQIANGTYNFALTAKNAWSQTSTNPSALTPTSGTDVENVDFGVFQLGIVSGVKFRDVDGDSAKDLDELGLESWTMQIDGPNNYHAEQQTDENGDYEFSGLSVGTYVVSEVGQENWIQTYPVNPSTYTVEIESGTLHTDKNFGNFELGKVSGTKWNDINGNGTRNDGDSGIVGWKFYLLKEGTKIDSALTGENGTYTLSGILAGTYTVEEETQDGWLKTFPVASNDYEVSISSGTSLTGKDFGNVKLGTISGIKYNDLNANSVRDNGENGIAGWKIYLSVSGSVTDSILTDANGAYTLRDLVEGTYDVSEEIQSGWVQTFPVNGTYSVSVNFGEDVTGKDFGNYKSSVINAHSQADNDADFNTNSDRLSIPWPITISRNDSIIASGNDSTLTLANLIPGTYVIAQRESSYWTQMGRVVDGVATEDSLEYSVTVVVQDGKVLPVYFVNKFVPDSTKFRSFPIDTLFSKKAVTLKIKKGKPYPMPNYANVRDAIVNASKAGLTVGIEQGKSSPDAKLVSWINFKKGADFGKYFTKIDTGKSHPLDSIRYPGKQTKKLVKVYKPTNKAYVNPLAQAMAVFKLNLNATGRGIILSDPAGADFRELIYVKANHPFNGMTLAQIGDRVDSMMTYWKNYGDSLNEHHPTYDSITVLLNKFSSAFVSQIDSVDNVSPTYQFLTLKGEIPIISIPYLARNRNLRTSAPVNFGHQRAIPEVFTLEQNYPNPFNPTTSISFYLPTDEFVTLKIFNILGQEVKTLIKNEYLESDYYEVDFDASVLSSGVYFYKLDAGDLSKTKKMMLLK